MIGKREEREGDPHPPPPKTVGLYCCPPRFSFSPVHSVSLPAFV
jgi:hypothetical protein